RENARQLDSSGTSCGFRTQSGDRGLDRGRAAHGEGRKDALLDPRGARLQGAARAARRNARVRRRASGNLLMHLGKASSVPRARLRASRAWLLMSLWGAFGVGCGARGPAAPAPEVPSEGSEPAPAEEAAQTEGVTLPPAHRAVPSAPALCRAYVEHPTTSPSAPACSPESLAAA